MSLFFELPQLSIVKFHFSFAINIQVVEQHTILGHMPCAPTIHIPEITSTHTRCLSHYEKTAVHGSQLNRLPVAEVVAAVLFLWCLIFSLPAHNLWMIMLFANLALYVLPSLTLSGWLNLPQLPQGGHFPFLVNLLNLWLLSFTCWGLIFLFFFSKQLYLINKIHNSCRLFNTFSLLHSQQLKLSFQSQQSYSSHFSTPRIFFPQIISSFLGCLERLPALGICHQTL